MITFNNEKKNNNFKKQNQIASTQSGILKNTKFHQHKVKV